MINSAGHCMDMVLLYMVFISKEVSLTCIAFVVILVSTAIGCDQISWPGNGQCSSSIPVAVSEISS